MSETVLYAVAGAVARVTLNRPDKRNAINAELMEGVRDGLARAGADAAVRVIVLTGAGADFCSGADLSGLQKARTAGVMENIADARQMADLFLALRRHPKLIVAAVQGRALAGGCGLATACDLILASESAKFGYPEVNLGFVPAMVMAILRRSVSEKRALELIVRGDVFTAAQALDMGLVNRVFADTDFAARVDQYVSELAAKSASAMTLCKNLLYHMDGMDFTTAIEAGVHVNGIARMTEDCQAGIDRFLKKV
jgi:methylglutaconyl-CoA hydratase